MKISIIGAAGILGSAAAFEIATRGLADELVLVDINRNVLLHHIMDINTALTGYHSTIVREGNSDEDLSGSDIVIVTAGLHIPDRAKLMEANVPLMKDIARRINRYCPDAIVITATNPVDPLNYAMQHYSGIDRHRILGYSLNDSTRFRMLIARALAIKTTQVEGIIIGEHVHNMVFLFSSIKVDGKPFSVSNDIKQNIRKGVPAIMKEYDKLNAGRTTGWTTAIGVTSIVSAIYGDTGQLIPCSIVLDGEYGCHNISMGVPSIIGKGGVKQILKCDLDGDEELELEHAIECLKETARAVDKAL
jgi:malate dehydrogenase